MRGHATFRIQVFDSRYPHLSITSDGGAIFQVVKNKKVIDSFTDTSIFTHGETSPNEIERRARLFFDELQTHVWLSKMYEKL